MKISTASLFLLLGLIIGLNMVACGSSKTEEKRMKAWSEVLKATEYPDGKGGVIVTRSFVSRADILGPPDTMDQMGGGCVVKIWFDKVILDGPTVPKEHQGRIACVQLDQELDLYYFLIGEPDVGKDCRTPASRKGLSPPTKIK